MTAESTAGSRRDALLFLLYSALFHIGLLGMVDVILNFYFVSLGHDTQTIGLLQSLPRLAGFITSVPVSLLANRIGTHRMITLATIGAGIAMLMVFIPSLPALGLSRFLLGFFYGAQQIALSPLMIALVDKKERTQFFALHNVTSMMAMAFGSFIGGYMPSLIVSALRPEMGAQTPFAYGTALFVSTMIVFISVIPFLYVSRKSGVPVPRDVSVPPVKVPWTHLMFIALPMLTFGFTGGLTFPFYNLFFRTRFEIPDETVGTILSIGWMGMALVPLLNPWWEGRLGRARALGMTMLIAACAFFGLSLAQTLFLSVITFTIGISFRNVMQPLYQPLVLESLPVELHNLASGMTMVLWNIGWFAATAISGFWQQTYGFTFIMQVVAAGVLMTGASVVLIFTTRRTYQPTTP
jgi:MFS family permease